MSYYADPYATLFHGDCLEVMAGMEPESVDLCVTSPPYYGLRRYPDTERVWGGVEGCEHKWQESKTGLLHENRNFQRGSQEEVMAEGRSLTYVHKYSTMLQSTCALCGAWRGSYGNEPLADCGAWMRSVLTGEPMELCNACYLCHSVQILRAIRRVLRLWGTVWWVVDDSMFNYRPGRGNDARPQGFYRQPDGSGQHRDIPTSAGNRKLQQPGIKEQDRMGIPERLSLALQADGWHWRSTIIWAKAREIEQDGEWAGEGSTMPESVKGWRWERCRVKVKRREYPWGEAGSGRAAGPSRSLTDSAARGLFAEYADCPGCPQCAPNGGYVLRKGNWRPTDSYERIIMLAKGLPYFGDSEAAAQPYVSYDGRRVTTAPLADASWEGAKGLDGHERWANGGRNPRSVWEINPEPNKLSHFAAFPSAIPRKIILAMTSAKGNCPKCGMPWAPVVERKPAYHDGETETAYATGMNANRIALLRQASRQRGQEYQQQSQVTGWLPSCRCGEQEAIPAIILDPFAGTGTTLAVAKALGRRSVGVELSARYCTLAARRLAAVSLPMEGME